jgi:3-hydroxyacyl-CoA dehydrogenase
MDAIVREYFFPAGVFEFFDSVGNDTMLTSIKNYVREYPHKDYYEPLIHCLENMVLEGRLGIKSHSGFYVYPKDRSDNSVSFLKNSENKSLVEEIRKRLYFSYISAVKRFAIQSKSNLEELNNAVKEYFGIEKGPFEM